MTAATQPQPAPLPRLRMTLSSRVERPRLPSFLVTNRTLGRELDQVVTEFIHDLKSSRAPGLVHIGAAWDATQESGRNRTVRIAHSLRPGHPLAVDVTFRAQGDELYVRFRLVAKTLIARLHWVLFGTAFLALWSVLYLSFLLTTDAHHALGQSFAQKYFPENAPAGVAVMVHGWDVDGDPSALSPYRRVKPWSVTDYCLADPVLFLQSLATVPAILAALVGSLLLLVPPHASRHACLWMGWPTPDDFDTALHAHRAWVEKILYQSLSARHGLTRTDLIEIPAS